MLRNLFGILALAAALAALAACSGAATETPTAAPPIRIIQPTTLNEGVTLRLGTPNPSPDCPDHYPWVFENRARECAATASNKWAALEHFEHGLMIWFQGNGETYILIEDGSPLKPYFSAVDSGGVANPPDPDPALAPPAGLTQPVQGFAKFWRGLVPGYDWVRPALGWATAPEIGYSSFYQCNTATDASARCYFSGPADEIIVLSRGQGAYWTYVKPPRP